MHAEFSEGGDVEKAAERWDQRAALAELKRRQDRLDIALIVLKRRIAALRDSYAKDGPFPSANG